MRAESTTEIQRKPMALFHLLYHETLELAVQPIVNLNDGKIEALEILSRVPNGALRPDEMFSLARQYNLLEQLTLLYCKKIADAAHLLLPFAPKGLFLNMEADIPNEVVRQGIEMISNRFQNVPIVIEVTEHVQSRPDWRTTAESLGCNLAMDDLGKGYSNFHELIELRPAFAKICMEIIIGLENSTIKSTMVSALCEISDAIKAEVIAEGIENFGDMNKLREIGLQYGQGYYFARPSRLHEIPFEEWETGYGHLLCAS